MLAIEKVVRNLSEEDYSKLKSTLESTRGHKFADLLSHYRNGEPDENLHEKLQISKNAFNVMKSRLYEKLQKHLISNGAVNSDSLFIHAINIPDLIYRLERNLAITLLEGLEKEFKELDLPEYLTVVYGAQKNLYFNTSRHYHYSKLYNRSVAYQLALNKAEEEFFGYKQMLGRFYLSGSKNLIQTLLIYKKEIEQIARINESPRFRLFSNMINASLAIHLPEEYFDPDFSVDHLLRETKDLIQSMPGNVFTINYSRAVDSLLFVYYNRKGLHHNAGQYLTAALNDNVELLNYSNIVCILPYLDERIIYSLKKKETPVLFDVSLEQVTDQEQEDALPYIALMKYNTLAHLLRGEYIQAYHCARILYSSISFKGIPVLEIEIKCLYTILSHLCDKEINTEAVLSGVSRKIRESEMDFADKEKANLLVKIIRARNSGSGKDARIDAMIQVLINSKSYCMNALQKLFSNEQFRKDFIK